MVNPSEDGALRAVVTDFGLARAVTPVTGDTITEPLTRAGAILGITQYMAPEQLEGGSVGPATKDSRAFCQTFYPWYNDDHRHSGIGMMTPAMVHYGTAAAVRENRQVPLDIAYAAHPNVPFGDRRLHQNLPKEVSINKPINSDEDTHQILQRSVSKSLTRAAR